MFCWQFFVGLGIGITLTHLIVILFRGRENIIMRPRDIRDNTDMNAFGCFLLYLFFALMSPIVFIFKMLYAISHARSSGRRVNSFDRQQTVHFNSPDDIRRFDD